MRQTMHGSPDGVACVVYECGREYDIPETARGRELAEVFLREGWAEDADALPVPAPTPPASSLPSEPPVERQPTSPSLLLPGLRKRRSR